MDIVERLLDYVEGVGVSEYKSDMSRYVANIMQDAADEIERLRTTCKELLQHAEYLLSETEKAKEKDVTLLQTRILRARAALKEGE